MPSRIEDPNAGFFAIDRRSWALACSRGLLPAVAYLVQACGTGGDNRTTRWSSNAVETYAGASRGRASAAVKDLIDCGLTRVTMAGTRPRYFLPPAHEVPGCEGYPPVLNSTERRLLAELNEERWQWFTNRCSRQWDGESPFKIAQALVLKGVAEQEPGGRRFSLSPYDAEKVAEPQWIWLPNSIVTGAAGETSPVALLRGTQSISALRLFVNLYADHALAENGGVHWRQLRKVFSRHKVGERGEFIVWGFQVLNKEAWPTAGFVAPFITGKLVEDEDGKKRDTGWQKFWEAEGILIALGLFEYVGHIVEADAETAEGVHPYAMGNGETDEQQLTDTAHRAGAALLTQAQQEWASEHALHMLPVAKGKLPNVALVGIPRLRYRPRTKATAAWFAKQQEWQEWRERYAALTESVAPHMQHQGEIKGLSR